jgi:SAM-dependent methyltransferase
MADLPKMYTEIAAWWPLLSGPHEYVEEAAIYVDYLTKESAAPPRTLLELGSGGGNNASHMKATIPEITLVDMAPEMLAVSRKLNPELEHIEGDMRNVRTGKTFDAVFIHDAISYMSTTEDLAAAIETAFVHTDPGGVALFCPDHTKDNFVPYTDHGGSDGADGRGLRYLEWMWDPDPSDSQYVAEYVYLLKDRDGSVRAMQDHHVGGLFSEAEWVAIIRDTGFTPKVVPFPHPDVQEGAVLFLGIKPPAERGTQNAST